MTEMIGHALILTGMVLFSVAMWRDATEIDRHAAEDDEDDEPTFNL